MKKIETINEMETVVLRRSFSGNTEKGFNLETALGDCDGLFISRTRSIYAAFCRYNVMVNNGDGECIAEYSAMYSTYISAVKALATYCGVAEVKNLIALIPTALYTIKGGTKGVITKRVPYTFATVLERTVRVVSSIIFDETDNAVTAFKAFVNAEMAKARVAKVSAKSALDRAEKAVDAFKSACTVLNVPSTDERAINGLKPLIETTKVARTAADNAAAEYDKITARTEAEWETLFVKSTGFVEIF